MEFSVMTMNSLSARYILAMEEVYSSADFTNIFSPPSRTPTEAVLFKDGSQ